MPSIVRSVFDADPGVISDSDLDLALRTGAHGAPQPEPTSDQPRFLREVGPAVSTEESLYDVREPAGVFDADSGLVREVPEGLGGAFAPENLSSLGNVLGASGSRNKRLDELVALNSKPFPAHEPPPQERAVLQTAPQSTRFGHSPATAVLRTEERRNEIRRRKEEDAARNYKSVMDDFASADMAEDVFHGAKQHVPYDRLMGKDELSLFFGNYGSAGPAQLNQALWGKPAPVSFMDALSDADQTIMQAVIIRLQRGNYESEKAREDDVASVLYYENLARLFAATQPAPFNRFSDSEPALLLAGPGGNPDFWDNGAKQVILNAVSSAVPSAGRSFGSTLGHNLLPSLGRGAGTMVGGTVGGAVGLPTVPFVGPAGPLLVGTALGTAGNYLGGQLGQGVQNLLEGRSFGEDPSPREMARRSDVASAHPLASGAANVLNMAGEIGLSGLRPGRGNALEPLIGRAAGLPPAQAATTAAAVNRIVDPLVTFGAMEGGGAAARLKSEGKDLLTSDSMLDIAKNATWGMGKALALEGAGVGLGAVGRGAFRLMSSKVAERVGPLLALSSAHVDHATALGICQRYLTSVLGTSAKDATVLAFANKLQQFAESGEWENPTLRELGSEWVQFAALNAVMGIPNNLTARSYTRKELSRRYDAWAKERPEYAKEIGFDQWLKLSINASVQYNKARYLAIANDNANRGALGRMGALVLGSQPDLVTSYEDAPAEVKAEVSRRGMNEIPDAAWIPALRRIWINAAAADKVRLKPHETGHILWDYARSQRPGLAARLEHIARQAPPEVTSRVHALYPELDPLSPEFLGEVFSQYYELVASESPELKGLVRSSDSVFANIRDVVVGGVRDLAHRFFAKDAPATLENMLELPPEEALSALVAAQVRGQMLPGVRLGPSVGSRVEFAKPDERPVSEEERRRFEEQELRRLEDESARAPLTAGPASATVPSNERPQNAIPEPSATPRFVFGRRAAGMPPRTLSSGIPNPEGPSEPSQVSAEGAQGPDLQSAGLRPETGVPGALPPGNSELLLRPDSASPAGPAAGAFPGGPVAAAQSPRLADARLDQAASGDHVPLPGNAPGGASSSPVFAQRSALGPENAASAPSSVPSGVHSRASDLRLDGESRKLGFHLTPLPSDDPVRQRIVLTRDGSDGQIAFDVTYGTSGGAAIFISAPGDRPLSGEGDIADANLVLDAFRAVHKYASILSENGSVASVISESPLFSRLISATTYEQGRAFVPVLHDSRRGRDILMNRIPGRFRLKRAPDIAKTITKILEGQSFMASPQAEALAKNLSNSLVEDYLDQIAGTEDPETVLARFDTFLNNLTTLSKTLLAPPDAEGKSLAALSASRLTSALNDIYGEANTEYRKALSGKLSARDDLESARQRVDALTRNANILKRKAAFSAKGAEAYEQAQADLARAREAADRAQARLETANKAFDAAFARRQAEQRSEIDASGRAVNNSDADKLAEDLATIYLLRHVDISNLSSDKFSLKLVPCVLTPRGDGVPVEFPDGSDGKPAPGQKFKIIQEYADVLGPDGKPRADVEGAPLSRIVRKAVPITEEEYQRHLSGTATDNEKAGLAEAGPTLAANYSSQEQLSPEESSRGVCLLGSMTAYSDPVAHRVAMTIARIIDPSAPVEVPFVRKAEIAIQYALELLNSGQSLPPVATERMFFVNKDGVRRPLDSSAIWQKMFFKDPNGVWQPNLSGPTGIFIISQEGDKNPGRPSERTDAIHVRRYYADAQRDADNKVIMDGDKPRFDFTETGYHQAIDVLYRLWQQTGDARQMGLNKSISLSEKTSPAVRPFQAPADWVIFRRSYFGGPAERVSFRDLVTQAYYDKYAYEYGYATANDQALLSSVFQAIESLRSTKAREIQEHLTGEFTDAIPSESGGPARSYPPGTTFIRGSDGKLRLYDPFDRLSVEDASAIEEANEGLHGTGDLLASVRDARPLDDGSDALLNYFRGLEDLDARADQARQAADEARSAEEASPEPNLPFGRVLADARVQSDNLSVIPGDDLSFDAAFAYVAGGYEPRDFSRWVNDAYRRFAASGEYDGLPEYLAVLQKLLNLKDFAKKISDVHGNLVPDLDARRAAFAFYDELSSLAAGVHTARRFAADVRAALSWARDLLPGYKGNPLSLSTHAGPYGERNLKLLSLSHPDTLDLSLVDNPSLYRANGGRNPLIRARLLALQKAVSALQDADQYVRFKRADGTWDSRRAIDLSASQRKRLESAVLKAHNDLVSACNALKAPSRRAFFEADVAASFGRAFPHFSADLRGDLKRIRERAGVSSPELSSDGLADLRRTLGSQTSEVQFGHEYIWDDYAERPLDPAAPRPNYTRRPSVSSRYFSLSTDWQRRNIHGRPDDLPPGAPADVVNDLLNINPKRPPTTIIIAQPTADPETYLSRLRASFLRAVDYTPAPGDDPAKHPRNRIRSLLDYLYAQAADLRADVGAGFKDFYDAGIQSGRSYLDQPRPTDELRRQKATELNYKEANLRTLNHFIHFVREICDNPFFRDPSQLREGDFDRAESYVQSNILPSFDKLFVEHGLSVAALAEGGKPFPSFLFKPARDFLDNLSDSDLGLFLGWYLSLEMAPDIKGPNGQRIPSVMESIVNMGLSSLQRRMGALSASHIHRTAYNEENLALRQQQIAETIDPWYNAHRSDFASNSDWELARMRSIAGAFPDAPPSSLVFDWLRTRDDHVMARRDLSPDARQKLLDDNRVLAELIYNDLTSRVEAAATRVAPSAPYNRDFDPVSSPATLAAVDSAAAKIVASGSTPIHNADFDKAWQRITSEFVSGRLPKRAQSTFLKALSDSDLLAGRLSPELAELFRYFGLDTSDKSILHYVASDDFAGALNQSLTAYLSGMASDVSPTSSSFEGRAQHLIRLFGKNLEKLPPASREALDALGVHQAESLGRPMLVPDQVVRPDSDTGSLTIHSIDPAATPDKAFKRLDDARLRAEARRHPENPYYRWATWRDNLKGLRDDFLGDLKTRLGDGVTYRKLAKIITTDEKANEVVSKYFDNKTFLSRDSLSHALDSIFIFSNESFVDKFGRFHFSDRVRPVDSYGKFPPHAAALVEPVHELVHGFSDFLHDFRRTFSGPMRDAFSGEEAVNAFAMDVLRDAQIPRGFDPRNLYDFNPQVFAHFFGAEPAPLPPRFLLRSRTPRLPLAGLNPPGSPRLEDIKVDPRRILNRNNLLAYARYCLQHRIALAPPTPTGERKFFTLPVAGAETNPRFFTNDAQVLESIFGFADIFSGRTLAPDSITPLAEELTDQLNRVADSSGGVRRRFASYVRLPWKSVFNSFDDMGHALSFYAAETFHGEDKLSSSIRHSFDQLSASFSTAGNREAQLLSDAATFLQQHLNSPERVKELGAKNIVLPLLNGSNKSISKDILLNLVLLSSVANGTQLRLSGVAQKPDRGLLQTLIEPGASPTGSPSSFRFGQRNSSVAPDASYKQLRASLKNAGISSKALVDAADAHLTSADWKYLSDVADFLYAPRANPGSAKQAFLSAISAANESREKWTSDPRLRLAHDGNNLDLSPLFLKNSILSSRDSRQLCFNGLSSLFSVATASLARDCAYVPIHNNFTHLLSDKNLVDAFGAAFPHGPFGSVPDFLRKYLRFMTKQGSSSGYAASLLTRLSANINVSLVAKPLQYLSQLSAGPAILAALPEGADPSVAIRAMGHPREALQWAQEMEVLHPGFRKRLEGQFDILSETLSGGKKSVLGNLRDKGLWFARKGDEHSWIFTGYALYSSIVDELTRNASPELRANPERIKEIAARRTWDVVDSTCQAITVAHRSWAESIPIISTLLLPFTTASRQLSENLRFHLTDAAQHFAAGRTGSAAKSLGRALPVIGSAFLYRLSKNLPLLLSSLAPLRNDDGDEVEFSFPAKPLFLGVLRTFTSDANPFFRAVLPLLSGQGRRSAEEALPFLSLYGDLAESIKRVYSGASSSPQSLGYAFEFSVFAASFLGLPASWIENAGHGIHGISQDRLNAIQAAGRLLGYSRSQVTPPPGSVRILSRAPSLADVPYIDAFDLSDPSPILNRQYDLYRSHFQAPPRQQCLDYWRSNPRAYHESMYYLRKALSKSPAGSKPRR